MKRFTFAAAALAATLALTGCSAAQGAQGSSAGGGDFVVGMYLEPRGLDPHRQTFWETYRVSRNILRGHLEAAGDRELV
jgi:peptide/nickel transport system substrate-binding protein